MKTIALSFLLLAYPATAFAQLATKRTGYRVLVTSQPSGALIAIQGQKIGTTPWRGYLRVGTWNIDLRRKGYAPRKKTIAVRRVRSQQRYHAELQANGGFLAIRGGDELTGATVHIDDHPAGTIGDTGYREPMAPGRYLVRLEKPGYQPIQWWATIRDAAETSRHVTLEPERTGVPLTLPNDCTARFHHPDHPDDGTAITRVHPDDLIQAAAHNRDLTITCQPPITESVPCESTGRVTSELLNEPLPTPAQDNLPAIEPDSQPEYKAPTRLRAGDYTVAIDGGFPRMLSLAIRVGTGLVLTQPATLEAGTYVLGNRLAAFAAGSWQPWQSGAWAASITLGAQAGSAIFGDTIARFAELHSGVQVAAAFPRVYLALALELETWTDLLCPRTTQCPSVPMPASDLKAAGVDLTRLDHWQWHARPLLSLTLHTTMHGGWALASHVSAAFHPRSTYLGLFGALLPDTDPLMYLQVGFRRTF